MAKFSVIDIRDAPWEVQLGILQASFRSSFLEGVKLALLSALLRKDQHIR